MKLKWDRLSILLAFVMGLMVLAAFVFGHVYFLAPIKQGADRAAQLVAEQTSLLADYPPEATLLDEYRQTYEETWEFLPEGERVDQELVIMEQLAAEENVLVQQIVRAEEPELIEGIDAPDNTLHENLMLIGGDQLAEMITIETVDQNATDRTAAGEMTVCLGGATAMGQGLRLRGHIGKQHAMMARM